MFERRGLCVYVFTHINVSSKLRICINRFNLTLLLTGGNKRLPLELQLFFCSKQMLSIQSTKPTLIPSIIYHIKLVLPPISVGPCPLGKSPLLPATNSR